MVDVVQQNDIVLSTEEDVFGYLTGIASNARVPFERGSSVNIVDRSTLPSNVAAFNVGIVVECPESQLLCWILVLNNDGSNAVVAIPKMHLTVRT